MTTQRIRVRTPRRRKIWAGYHTAVDVTSGATPDVNDVLDQTFTDLGLNNMAGVTVMRVVGFMQMSQWTAAATTPIFDVVRAGLAWLPKDVAAAGAGNSAIPRPAQIGTRDTRWYQQWVLGGLESNLQIVSFPLEPFETSRVEFDITNMQKQPTADSKFCLVTHVTGGAEDDTYRLTCEFDILLALP